MVNSYKLWIAALKRTPIIFHCGIGAYLGEVIKRYAAGKYIWYEFKSIQENTNHLNKEMIHVKDESVLYSQKLDKVICPIYETIQYLK